MGFLKKFGITFGSKKNKYLPEGTSKLSGTSILKNSNLLTPIDSSAYKTIAMFDLNIEGPKYEGAIPEATITFYPLK